MLISEISILPLTDKIDVRAVAEIAKPIWHLHYDPIIGKQQVDYMLDKFQSSAAIEQQMADGYLYYQVLEEEQIVGYFSLQIHAQNNLFISKFYLLENTRGKGFGREMLKYIERFAIKNNCSKLKLTVNKHNPAYKIYLKLGFTNDGSAEFDIGNGYIMDDYLMSKKIV